MNFMGESKVFILLMSVSCKTDVSKKDLLYFCTCALGYLLYFCMCVPCSQLSVGLRSLNIIDMGLVVTLNFK